MPKRAFIIGGSGQIGRAVASRLLDDGWAVVLGSRSQSPLPKDLIERGARTVILDRTEPDGLRRAIADGADLLLDTIAYGADDATQLLAIQADVSQFVAISSVSVYCDDEGRTLDEAFISGFPVFPAMITEEHAVVPPGPETYSTRKIAMERTLLDGASVAATVVRPGAIHGPYSAHPREWWFVKRLRDGREQIPLAYEGRSRFQTSATANIAALLAAIGVQPVTGIFNAVDPNAPSVAEIGRAIMAVTGRDAALIGNPDARYPPRIGANPWAIPLPIVLSDAAARDIGYRPVGDYSGTALAACQWLMEQPLTTWKETFPVLASYPWNLFDYAAEDAWLEAHPELG